MQRGEADFTLTQMPTFVVDSDITDLPIVPGPVTSTYDTRIASHTEPPKSGRHRDIDESLFVFDLDVVAIYILICLLIWKLIDWSIKILAKKATRPSISWDMNAILFSQFDNYDKYVTHKAIKVSDFDNQLWILYIVRFLSY